MFDRISTRVVAVGVDEHGLFPIERLKEGAELVQHTLDLGPFGLGIAVLPLNEDWTALRPGLLGRLIVRNFLACNSHEDCSE